MEVKYFINEKNIKSQFGVYVSASSGILDLPAIKEPVKQDWQEYHGVQIDLDAPRLQEREISLDCFINASNQLDFIQKLNAFYAEFLKSGFKRLRIEVDTTILIYDTYIKDTIKITKQWSEGSQQGKFTLRLMEPMPQKKILKFVATANALTCVINIATPSSVIITWGDNLRSDEIFSGGFDAVHTYNAPGTYYISIQGNINEIEGLTLDEQTTVLWELL